MEILKDFETVKNDVCMVKNGFSDEKESGSVADLLFL